MFLGANQTSLNQGFLTQGHRSIVIEYYSTANTLCILNKALGQPQRRGLIHVDTPQTSSMSAQEQDLSRLNAIDQAYLRQRGVHQLPPKRVW
jgi:hypothetical protein